MSFESGFGRLLYQSLPAVYRERDVVRTDRENPLAMGDLACYLDALGTVLDRVRATLDQRLRDAFPDNPRDGGACQEWVVPYFARLLDVRLVSPDLAGKRDEVAHAVRWRQGLGTLVSAEEIAEAVTRAEVELQEGWRRVAVTPRVGFPLLPLAAFGMGGAFDPARPGEVASHPGVPAATVDLRCVSRAVRAARIGPGVKESRLGGVVVAWRQARPHGVPEAPGSFDDVSRRTPDLRTPDPSRGHAHPRRLLVFAPTPRGLFPAEPITVPAADLEARIAEVLAGGPGGASQGDTPLRHVQVVLEADARAPRGGTAEVAPRRIRIAAASAHPVEVVGDVAISLPTGQAGAAVVEDLAFRGKVAMGHGALRLSGVVATEVAVESVPAAPDAPVLEVVDTLLGTVHAANGQALFERSTVRRVAFLKDVRAHDTIFAGTLAGESDFPVAGAIEHSRVPASMAAAAAAWAAQEPGARPTAAVDAGSCTTEGPVFVASGADADGAPVEADAGVLSPDCPRSVLFGAADGGEMGVGHGGRVARPVVVRKNQIFALAPTDSGPQAGSEGDGGDPATPAQDVVLRDVVFAGEVKVAKGARDALRLERVAVKSLVVRSDPRLVDGRPAPVLAATSCLIGEVKVANGIARLEYCTVLDAAWLAAIEASDCVFAGSLRASGAEGALCPGDCVRWSRVPALVARRAATRGVHLVSCTAAEPLFVERDLARGLAGAAGCGVLHPAAPEEISAGAEDGGEMGAYHDRRYSLMRAAVLEKLAEHLPVGLEPVLIPDPRLELAPAEETTP